MPENPLIIFLRMPKTGSQTLKTIVQNVYRSEELFIISDEVYNHYEKRWTKVTAKKRWQIGYKSFEKTKDSEISSLSAIVGHTWFGIHEFTSRECKYVTFLRHPVRRFTMMYWKERSVRKKVIHGLGMVIEKLNAHLV